MRALPAALLALTLAACDAQTTAPVIDWEPTVLGIVVAGDFHAPDGSRIRLMGNNAGDRAGFARFTFAPPATDARSPRFQRTGYYRASEVGIDLHFSDGTNVRAHWREVGGTFDVAFPPAYRLVVYTRD